MKHLIGGIILYMAFSGLCYQDNLSVLEKLDGGENLFAKVYQADPNKEYCFFGFYFGMTRKEYYDYMDSVKDELVMTTSSFEPGECTPKDRRKVFYHFVASLDDPMYVSTDVTFDPVFSADTGGYLIQHAVVFSRPVYSDAFEQVLVNLCTSYIGEEVGNLKEDEAGRYHQFEKGELTLYKKGYFDYGLGCMKNYGHITLSASKELLDSLVK